MQCECEIETDEEGEDIFRPCILHEVREDAAYKSGAVAARYATSMLCLSILSDCIVKMQAIESNLKKIVKTP